MIGYLKKINAQSVYYANNVHAQSSLPCPHPLWNRTYSIVQNIFKIQHINNCISIFQRIYFGLIPKNLNMCIWLNNAIQGDQAL